MGLERSPPAKTMNDGLRAVESQAALAARSSAHDERVAALEGTVERLGDDIQYVRLTLDRVLALATASPAQAGDAPPTATAAAGASAAHPGTLLDDSFAAGDDDEELERVDLADINNRNVAHAYPDIEATAQAMAAGGGGLRAAGIPAGGVSAVGHIADLPCAPLLENCVRGRASQQGAVVAVLDDNNQVVLMKGAGDLGGGRKQLSERQLLEAIPNPFVFMKALAFRKRYMVSKHALQGSELLAYTNVFEPQLLQLAERFMGGHELVSGDKFIQGWQAFLVFERKIIFEIYEQRLSFADLPMHLHGSLMHEAMSMRFAGARVGRAAVSASSGRGAGAGAWGASAPTTFAKYLATEVPEEYRATCCVPFWRDGKCGRATCTHAASHKCLRCGASDHGGGQCRAAAKS